MVNKPDEPVNFFSSKSIDSDKILFFKEYESKQIIISRDNWKTIKNFKSPAIKFRIIETLFEYSPICKIQVNTFSYIGLINISNILKIVITPKISEEHFISMLKYVEPDRIQSWNLLFEGVKKKENFIDFFILQFLNSIEAVLQNKSSKGYSFIQENRIIPKGKINLARSIQNLKYFPIPLNCVFFNYDLDTPYNQVIKYTLLYIKTVVPRKYIRKYYAILKILNSVQFRKWSVNKIRNLSYSRLNIHYKPIHKVCIMILDDFSLYFSLGVEIFYTFLINSWNIFERFLFNIFRIFQNDFNVDSYCIKNQIEEKNEVNTERPDIILSKNNLPEIIIDAKYKRFEKFRNDKYQMNWYLGIYDLPIGFLIYPAENVLSDDNDLYDYKMEEYVQNRKNKCIFFVQLNLSKISQESNIQRFVSEIISVYKKKKGKMFE